MNLIIGLKVFYDAKLDNMGDIYSKEFSFAFFRHYSKLSKKDKNNFMEDYISIMKDIKPTEFGIKQKNIN
jgi:hypothetical protein